MSTTTTAVVQRRRLIDLAVWVAGEQAKKDLGLPSEWDQKKWLGSQPCGTTCCIAGKVALEDGGIPTVYDGNGDPVTDPKLAWALWGSDEYYSYDMTTVFFPGSDDEIDVEWYAGEVLGLTREERLSLFYGDNDLATILKVIREILASRELV